MGVYVHVYVCMYVCIYACGYIDKACDVLEERLSIWVCMCMCMCTCVCVCMYEFMCTTYRGHVHGWTPAQVFFIHAIDTKYTHTHTHTTYTHTYT